MLSRSLFLTGVAAALVFLTISGAQSQTAGQMKNVYNPTKLETIKGEVVKLDLSRLRSGRGCGMDLTVLTEGKKTIDVRMGPAFYIEEQPIELRPKDKVEVTGSWITRHGMTHFVAGNVRKGNEVLKLRDEKGHPLWLPPRAK